MESATVSISEWEAFTTRQPGVHLLQTSQWGRFKEAYGWQADWLVKGETGAQILFRGLPLGFSLAYIPKGPVGADWESLWPEIDALCHTRRAAFLRIEPDLWEAENSAAEVPAGFHAGANPIQPLRTIVVNLEDDRETILARMKQKTRYNIRLAARRGVRVFPGSDVDQFYNMLVTTGEREAFGVHSREYYQDVYALFHDSGRCELLFAEYEGQLLAGVMVFWHQDRAWYFYGASNEMHRNLMPTYLLQWEAMCLAKDKGCREYDLWGIPDVAEQQLEDGFTNRSDGLWGVYRFKRGFGGEVRRGAGPWDRVYHPLLYNLYRWWSTR
jgi:lipid II:glycine glycyltransferase (peptidoglycan interpeptide bridge formation enzyme)